MKTRRVRVHFFNPWARALEDIGVYLDNIPHLDLSEWVERPDDADLLQRARLDCDWHGECARCFSSLVYHGVEFLPARILGVEGLLNLAQVSQSNSGGEEWWLCLMAQHPQKFAKIAGSLFALLRQRGVRILYYAFDEASRSMQCFESIAPHLDILIHDEYPICPIIHSRLRIGCQTVHRSWMANLVPFSVHFNERPEPSILFLGSQLGLTAHRRKQIEFLRYEFKDRFIAYTNHSVSVADRLALGRYKVGWSPEGRMFTTQAMSRSHTDRPFWSGCLGMVPLSENSRAGDRLEELSQAGLIERYEHGDLQSLRIACERALEWTVEQRRQVYEHFNRCQTVGSLVAQLISDFVFEGGVQRGEGMRAANLSITHKFQTSKIQKILKN